jgi:hypothetical protein
LTHLGHAVDAFDLRASIEKRGMLVSTALPPPNLDHLQQASAIGVMAAIPVLSALPNGDCT